MQLRERSTQVHSPKSRLAVTTEFKDSASTPLPIKIYYIKVDESAIPMVLR